MGYPFPIRIVDERTYQAGFFEERGDRIERRPFERVETLLDSQAGRLYVVREPESGPAKSLASI